MNYTGKDTRFGEASSTCNAKETEVATQRQTKVKKHAKTTKWKALVLEQSVKVVLFDQLLEN
jgi:hypothetical protein